MEFGGPTPFHEIHWGHRRKGRAWREQARSRHELSPEKIEMIAGKLFWSERDRLVTLGLPLENLGVDKAIRIGDPNVWRDAIAHIDEPIDMDAEADIAQP